MDVVGQQQATVAKDHVVKGRFGERGKRVHLHLSRFSHGGFS
jgi:hypothetical protein